MIVKNESRVIQRLLSSVAPFIDAYVICDTGSTDDTIPLIRSFFQIQGIPGHIVEEPFRDFGYNRSFALQKADELATECDYVLLLDADMILWLNPAMDVATIKNSLTEDAYHIFQGSDAFYYKNSRIVRRGIGASYWGVTHEYLSLKEGRGSKTGLLPKSTIFIKDIGDGGAKADKFERDIRLLKRGLEEHPTSERYMFYLANSYRDHGDTDLAIETYKRRIAAGGWFEEVWYSMYNIGVCYKSKGDMISAIHWWMEAYQFFPKRVENLYEIITHYRQQGKPQLAYLFYNMALKQVVLHNNNPDYLFLKKDIYDYKLDYEFSIFGYYCNIDNFDLTRICMKVVNCPLVESSIVQNVLSNYKFYAKKLTTWAEPASTTFPGQQAILSLIQDKWNAEVGPGFVSSTPSLCLYSINNGNNNGNHKPQTILSVCVRYVNYKINETGGYENQNQITTINKIAHFDWETGQQIVHFVSPSSSSADGDGDNDDNGNDIFIQLIDDTLVYDTSYDNNKDNNNPYVGVEDVRLFWNSSLQGLCYNGNRGLGAHNIVVEIGTVVPAVVVASSGNTYASGFIGMPNDKQQQNVEKNWVVFEDANKTQKIIYAWHDLCIGDRLLIDDNNNNNVLDTADDTASASSSTFKYRFRQTHSIQTPNIFSKIRGSTNGVTVGREIWFICHAVSYEDRRYYYHMFVALCPHTYAIRKYTPLFTFEGEKVEYTLGFVYRKENNTFCIGYSTMDRTTKFMNIKKSAVENMCLGMTL